MKRENCWCFSDSHLLELDSKSVRVSKIFWGFLLEIGIGVFCLLPGKLGLLAATHSWHTLAGMDCAYSCPRGGIALMPLGNDRNLHPNVDYLKLNQLSCLGSFDRLKGVQLHVVSSPSKQATSRCRDNVPGHIFFSPRSYVNATCRSFSSTAGLRHGNRLHNGDRLRRHTIVRSEFVGAGASDVDYPLSEPHLGSKVRGIFFYAVTSVAAILLFMVMVVAHPFTLLLDRYRRKAHHFIAKIWALIAITPFVKVEFEGLENLPPSDTAAVYVSNHQSFLDIYTLLTLGRSFKFISKTAIFLIPIIGWAMFFMGVIPLKRMDSRSQMECFRRCMDLIKKGGSVFFFPEGTRSKDGKLGAFKKGAFTIAAKTKVPVVPITLIGTGNIMPSGQESILNPGTVRVLIHKPISGNNAEALCNEARNIIADALIYQG